MTRVEDSTTWVLKRGSSEAGEFKLGLLEFKDELPIFFFRRDWSLHYPSNSYAL